MNNDELYHYGIKNMRWKNHKYKAIKNGKRIYDIVKYNLGGQARKDYLTSRRYGLRYSKYDLSRANKSIKIGEKEYRRIQRDKTYDSTHHGGMTKKEVLDRQRDYIDDVLRPERQKLLKEMRQERKVKKNATRRFDTKSFNALAKRGQQRWSAEARETVDALKTKVRTGKSNFRKKRRKVKRAITKARRSYAKLYNKYAQQARTNGVGKTYAQAFKDGFKDGQAKYYKKHKTNR